MALYLIKYEGGFYANEELYIKAVAGTEKKFKTMLATRALEGKLVLDQFLYPITETQKKEISRSYAPQLQDFDTEYKQFNVLREEEIDNTDTLQETYPGVLVLTVSLRASSGFYDHRHVKFCKLKDFNPSRGYKYYMLHRLAKVRICKGWYIALNAVNITTDRPIIVIAGK